MPDWVTYLQWPAMAITIGAAWLVASSEDRRRKIGFYAYIGSNALWIAWGLSASAWALIALQFALFAMNVRGAKKETEKAGAECD